MGDYPVGMEYAASVLVNGSEFTATRSVALAFGRSSQNGVVGLDDSDMGISAIAGSIEYDGGVWWITNRSSKRPLYVEEASGTEPRRIESKHRVAINRNPTRILVRGVIYTHLLEVTVPEESLAVARSITEQSTGTLTDDNVVLSAGERLVLAALYSGFLRVFPRRDANPLTYRQAAELLGLPWTETKVRKRVEHLRERLEDQELYFNGPNARYELAAFLLDRQLLTPADLERLDRLSGDVDD